MTERLKQDLIDGLRRFQNDLDRDFSFRDIQKDIKDYISRKEFMEIATLPDEEKIEKILFTFIYVKKDPLAFIKHLKESYRWIYDNIMKARDNKWVNDYRLAIQDIPNNQDWNIHRTQLLWEIQRHLKNLPRSNYLILFGKLGFGKRWLAV